MESAHKNWTSPTFDPGHIVHYHTQRYVLKFNSILSYACAIPHLYGQKNSGWLHIPFCVNWGTTRTKSLNSGHYMYVPTKAANKI